MSKKICFSSVLRQKRNSYPRQLALMSLGEILQLYLINPEGDYTLRYPDNNSLHSNTSKQDFEEGYNPLDQWISHQIQNNKQNLFDLPPKKQIPNQLLKYVTTPLPRSPKKSSQIKTDFVGLQLQNLAPQKMDMKEICREYAENKKNGGNGNKDGPVWKFASKQEDEDQDNIGEILGNRVGRDSDVVRESIGAEKFKQEGRLDQRENQLLHQQFSRLKKQKISNAVKTLPQKQSKGQTLSLFIQQIKNNLAHQIQAMAQRIIQDRKNSQQANQTQLISQRENDEQKRLEKARKQIEEYLSMKKEVSQSEKKEEVEVGQAQKRKRVRQSLKQLCTQTPKQKLCSSQIHQQVSYSFASDFNGAVNTDQPNPDILILQPKQPNEVLLLQNNNTLELPQLPQQTTQRSLANIDEVKSQQGDNEKRGEDFVEQSVQIELKKKVKQDTVVEIDRNFIKQIESVAYMEMNTGEQSPHHVPNTQYLPQITIHQELHQSEPKLDHQSTEKAKQSKPNQIIKNQSIVVEQPDNNQVNISVGKQSESAHNSTGKKIVEFGKDGLLQVDIQGFEGCGKNQVGNTKQKENTEIGHQIGSNNKIQIQQNININQTEQLYITREIIPEIIVQVVQNQAIPTPAPVPTQQISSVNHKTSFTSVIYTNANNTKCPPVSIPQQTPSPPLTIKSSLKHIVVNQQNTKQVVSSLNNSNSKQEEGGCKQSRKLKITLSPKYATDTINLGKYQTVPVVTDFKIGVGIGGVGKGKQIIETVGNSNKQSLHGSTNGINCQPTLVGPKTSFTSTLATIQNTNTTNPAMVLSLNKYKVDDLLINIAPLPHTITAVSTNQCKQSIKRSVEHALIRADKYERVVQKIVEATKTGNPSKISQSIKTSQQFQFNIDF